MGRRWSCALWRRANAPNSAHEAELRSRGGLALISLVTAGPSSARGVRKTIEVRRALRVFFSSSFDPIRSHVWSATPMLRLLQIFDLDWARVGGDEGVLTREVASVFQPGATNL